jgi:hypothetical protein
VPTPERQAQITRLLPTIYPTATELPSPTPTETRAPGPTATATSQVDFQQTAVELRYQIPALDLDRAIVGDVSGHIQLTDGLTGREVLLSNRPGILFEMQQYLPGVLLATTPEGCTLCTLVSYELPLTGDRGAGWISDARLLASIENFTSANLGPHMPPRTVVGLRRSATPYYPAHTVAVTGGGELWMWAAIEERPSPARVLPATSPLLSLFRLVDQATLDRAYGASCPEGAGIESLYMDSETGPNVIQVVCPELALPTGLVALYSELSRMADAFVADWALPAPEPAFPLEGVLAYQRAGGERLTLFVDHRTEILAGDSVTVTGFITPTLAISLTEALVASNLLNTTPDEVLVQGEGTWVAARGPRGVMALGWADAAPEALVTILARLDRLIGETLLAITEAPSTPGSATPATQTAVPQP